MAIVSSTETRDQSVANEVRTLVWSPLLNGDSGAPFSMPGWADRSVQIRGTFGVGGTCVIEGSNDTINWATLADPAGIAISKTSAGLFQISQSTRQIRPRVSAGDGTTSITVTLLARRPSSP